MKKRDTRMTDAALLLWMMSKTTNVRGCLEWNLAKNGDGYGTLNYKGKTVLATRLALEIYYGAPLGTFFACHKCDNPACINIEHLFIGTSSENTLDAFAKGRITRKGFPGQSNPRAKISNQQADEIRNSGESQSALAKKYGLTQSTISRIKSGKRRKL